MLYKCHLLLLKLNFTHFKQILELIFLIFFFWLIRKENTGYIKHPYQFFSLKFIYDQDGFIWDDISLCLFHVLMIQ